jgi:hypothetical protein
MKVLMVFGNGGRMSTFFREQLYSNARYIETYPGSNELRKGGSFMLCVRLESSEDAQVRALRQKKFDIVLTDDSFLPFANTRWWMHLRAHITRL